MHEHNKLFNQRVKNYNRFNAFRLGYDDLGNVPLAAQNRSIERERKFFLKETITRITLSVKEIKRNSVRKLFAIELS